MVRSLRFQKPLFKAALKFSLWNFREHLSSSICIELYRRWTARILYTSLESLAQSVLIIFSSPIKVDFLTYLQCMSRSLLKTVLCSCKIAEIMLRYSFCNFFGVAQSHTLRKIINKMCFWREPNNDMIWKLFRRLQANFSKSK